MDPSLTNPPPPAAVWNQPDQENYMAPAANPAPTNGHSHPSYPEMVLAAIGALKEKDGSSRQAIAKYIEQVYTDLPSDNSVLLTRHLKWMKQAGQLMMVKHSYMLPGSASLLPQPAPAGNDPATEPKRRSGRPPKPKAEYQLVVVPPPPVQESIFVSLGLVDEPVPSPPAIQAEIDVSQAHSVFGKRGRGRPPKLTPVHFPVQQTAPASQNGSKRKRGRPSKLDSLGSVVQRLGGRPKKVPKPTNGTPRGRPPKYVVLTATGVGKEQAGVTPEKRRGRRKGSSLKKSRRLSGKPLGRPRKLIGREGGAEQNQIPPAHGDDLVKKLEYIQAKIKQVVSAVKPHLNSITAANALGELQELEQLASEKLQVNHQLQVHPVDNPPAQITIVSQKPVLVPPPAHFSVPTSVPIAAPDMYPISYSAFQAAYQAQSQH